MASHNNENIQSQLQPVLGWHSDQPAAVPAGSPMSPAAPSGGSSPKRLRVAGAASAASDALSVEIAAALPVPASPDQAGGSNASSGERRQRWRQKGQCTAANVRSTGRPAPEQWPLWGRGCGNRHYRPTEDDPSTT